MIDEKYRTHEENQLAGPLTVILSRQLRSAYQAAHTTWWLITVITSCPPATALDPVTEDPEMNQLSLPSRNQQPSQQELNIIDKTKSTPNSLKEKEEKPGDYKKHTLNIYKNKFQW